MEIKNPVLNFLIVKMIFGFIMFSINSIVVIILHIINFFIIRISRIFMFIVGFYIPKCWELFSYTVAHILMMLLYASVFILLISIFSPGFAGALIFAIGIFAIVAFGIITVIPILATTLYAIVFIPVILFWGTVVDGLHENRIWEHQEYVDIDGIIDEFGYNITNMIET
jgi:hypothetical protein